jgi:hypothetical protein
MAGAPPTHRRRPRCPAGGVADLFRASVPAQRTSSSRGRDGVNASTAARPSLFWFFLGAVVRPLPPKEFSLSAVAEACPFHCPVLRPMPRHADARRIERNGAAETAAHFSGEPEASSVSSLSFFFGLAFGD